METRKAVSVYLRPSLIKRIEAQAAFHNRTVSNYIEWALEASTPMDGSPVIFATTPANYQGFVGNASEGPAMSQEERAALAKNRR
jgi:hypothetical protein